MRCLQCGSTISAFKKLTDTDFCSAEHRDSFYEAQQRLIISRLKQSAQRFQRLHRPSAATSAARLAPVEPVVVAPPELKAPAPIAAYFTGDFELRERLSGLHAVPPFDFSAVAFRPRFSAAASQNRRRLSQLIPDFPWARYNPGLRWFSNLLLDDEGDSALRITPFIFERRSADAFSFPVSGLLTPSRPGLANRPSCAARIAPRMARPKPRISLDPVRLAAVSQRFGVGYCGLRLELGIASIAPPPMTPFLESAPIALAASFDIPGSLRLSADFQAKGMAFLDRVYRMRPRMGVLSDSVPTARPVELEPFASGVAKTLPPGPPAPQSSVGLAFVNRFSPPRPTDPMAVDATSTAQNVSVEPGAPLLGVSPAFPGSMPGISAKPAQADRFFRPRPRGPVAPELAVFEALPGQPEDWQSTPASASLPNPSFGFEPKAVTSLFRMRPRSGVLSVSLADLATSSNPDALLSAPVTPALDPIAEPSPAIVARMFRMRPKNGVDVETTKVYGVEPDPCEAGHPHVAKPAAAPPELPAKVAFVDQLYVTCREAAVTAETQAYAAISAGDPGSTPTADPALPLFLPVATHPAPGVSTRLVRSRPRQGVMDAALAASIGSSTEVEVLQSAPATPSVPLGDCAPVLVVRMFRPRPRLGVGLETAAAQEKIDATASDFVVVASVPSASFPAQALSPAPLDKFLRDRPRAGVLASNLGPSAPAAASAVDFTTRPVATLQSVPGCAPAFANRLFRFRPKAAVDATARMETSFAAAEPFPAGKPEFMPDWWDVLHGAKPAFVNKMYRMRLKNPAQDQDTVTRDIRTKHIPVPDPEPVLATLPPPAPPAEPSFLDRLYRMRPRGGKASEPAANAIPCAAIEPRVHSGAPRSVLQSVSRQWKATPLSVKSLAVTLPLMLILAVFPWSRPTEAATKPIREAMVRRAAIERAPTFTDGLSQWRGSERWKQTPSGAIEPVGLALFEPSLQMRNYRFTFAAQLHKGGVGFVVRAADERNYQAVKLKIAKPGPLPVVRLVRWAVVDGVTTERKETPLPVTVSADTQYRVAVEVNEQSFTLMVQDQVVDSWSEEQLKTGGAGFFGDKGERASIHSVRMTHQDDAIGKLFAALMLPERSSN